MKMTDSPAMQCVMLGSRHRNPASEVEMAHQIYEDHTLWSPLASPICQDHELWSGFVGAWRHGHSPDPSLQIVQDWAEENSSPHPCMKFVAFLNLCQSLRIV